MNPRNYKEHFTPKRIIALVIVLGSTAAFALLMQWFVSFYTPVGTQRVSKVSNTTSLSEKIVNPFDTVALVARGAYVYDLKTNTVLFAKNENEKLPLASVTKLMTALVARESMSASAVLTLTKDDLAAEGDTGLRPGERWRLGDLLRATLIISSNDGAHAVASFVGANGHPENYPDMSLTRANFIQMMNAKAVELGLDQMEFFNESGLDVSTTQNGLPEIVSTAGGYGSAKNVAELIAELWSKYPDTVEVTARKEVNISSQDKIAHYLPNTNEIVGKIPGLIASKTGFTDLAGGNLAVIFDRGIGDAIVIVVLGSGYKERFEDVQKLVAATILVALSQN
ncbi:MAG: serine hydrolase [Candidatus Paceibacterota bacterium]|jgi:D-alanyl-D-alanine carboxypeptidase